MKIKSRLVPVFIGLAAVFVIIVAQITSVMADTPALWSSGNPVTESATDAGTESNWRDNCATKFHTYKSEIRLVTQDVTTKTDCFLGTTQDGVNLYTYAQQQAIGVQFPGDAGAYRTTAPCYSCVYMPSNDTYINVEYNNTLGAGRVAIYHNFIHRLTLQNSQTLNDRYYKFDNSSPDLISNYGDQPGFFGFARYIQKSSNDKWLVITGVGMPLIRFNMESKQMLMFSGDGLSYGVGSDPTIEFDVTDDGQHVAMFGQNSPDKIYDINDNCGKVLPSSPQQSDLQSLPNACPSLYLVAPFGNPANNTYMPRMRDAYQPQFSEDGGEITFYAKSNDQIPDRKIALKASNYTGQQPLDYLALGDSFSSGEGDIDPNGVNYYRQFTDVLGDPTAGVPQEKCHISTRSYPYLLAKGMNLSISGPKQWDTVACSGATTWDIKSQGSSDYQGQWDRLKGFDVNTLKTQALNEFIPGRQKQIEFVKKYKPKVITLTIGGNDVDFINKLLPCVYSPSTCDYANSARGDIASTISNQYENLKNLYSELYAASDEKAKIYVLSYPNFINGDASATCGINVAGLDGAERELMSNSITYMNNVIKQAAHAAGVKYIDIQNSLDGHRLCDAGDKDVNAAVWRIGTAGFSDYGSFHPNANGQQAIARSIWSEQNINQTNLLDYAICPTANENICPDSSATKDNIEVPGYFQNITWMNTFYKQLTPFEHFVNGTVDLSIGAYTFAANTIATITGHSDPVDLGQYTTSPDGSLRINIKLPSSVSVGFHRIIVSGQSYSGDTIEYEQTILIEGSDPTDIDADGIPDNQDKCLFITSSNQDIDADGIDDACDPQIGSPPPTPTPTPTPKPSLSPSPTPAPSPKPTPQPIVKTLISLISKLVVIVIKIILKF